jgi:hypothetical protein
MADTYFYASWVHKVTEYAFTINFSASLIKYIPYLQVNDTEIKENMHVLHVLHLLYVSNLHETLNIYAMLGVK